MRHFDATPDEVDTIIILLSELMQKKTELEQHIRMPGGLKLLITWGEVGRRIARLEELLRTIKVRTGDEDPII